jgi:hypothetical protein
MSTFLPYPIPRDTPMDKIADEIKKLEDYFDELLIIRDRTPETTNPLYMMIHTNVDMEIEKIKVELKVLKSFKEKKEKDNE